MNIFHVILVTHSRARRPQRASPGFTLVELLLALAILAGLAALAVPSFSGLLADRSLVRAGDQLMVEMMQSRLAAMRNGRSYLLQAMEGSGTIRVSPWVEVSDMTEANDQTGTTSALMTGGNITAGTMRQIDVEKQSKESQLPAATTISKIAIKPSERDLLILSQMQMESQNGWSSPILFFPDGSSSTAAITLSYEGVGRVIILLRGLTGEVTVSEILQP